MYDNSKVFLLGEDVTQARSLPNYVSVLTLNFHTLVHAI